MVHAVLFKDHLKIGFRPLTGMVFVQVKLTFAPTKFSPPYGDSTSMMNVKNMEVGLSPPYGDCTDIDEQLVRDMGFSPPYGDCTKSCWKKLSLDEFSPPYGDCTKYKVGQKVRIRFSPPCGDCTLNISQNTAKLKSRMARKYSLYYNNVLLC